MELRFSSRLLGGSLRIGRRPNTHFLFVRHGQSTGNLPEALGQGDTQSTIKKETPNPALPLTPLGEQQARDVAGFLAQYIQENNLRHGISSIALWSSRYTRAMSTADPIEAMFTRRCWDFKRRFSDYLGEVDSGSIDGYSFDHIKSLPGWQMFAERDALLKQHGFGFHARRGDGESFLDASRRFDGAMDHIYRDADHRGHRLVIVVCHGLLMKVAYGRLSHADRRDRHWHQTFDSIPTVPNCGVMHFTSHEPRVVNPARFGLVYPATSTQAGQEA